MKKVAGLILNRNLPNLADELGDWILEYHSSLLDLYILENGSDPDKYSKYANIILKTSLGPAGGINEGLHQLMEKGYEYVWVNYNDARYNEPGFLEEALKTMKKDPDVAIIFPFWENNMWVYGKRHNYDVVTFTSILGFVVRCDALKKLVDTSRFRLEPLWDSSNFSNHDNILATLLALYEQKMCALTSRRFTVFELLEPADTSSVKARGFSAEEWKHIKGPTDVEAWYTRAFPELKGTYKVKRAMVMRQIQKLIRQYKIGSINQFQEQAQWVSRKSKTLLEHLRLSL